MPDRFPAGRRSLRTTTRQDRSRRVAGRGGGRRCRLADHGPDRAGQTGLVVGTGATICPPGIMASVPGSSGRTRPNRRGDERGWLRCEGRCRRRSSPPARPPPGMSPSDAARGIYRSAATIAADSDAGGHLAGDQVDAMSVGAAAGASSFGRSTGEPPIRLEIDDRGDSGGPRGGGPGYFGVPRRPAADLGQAGSQRRSSARGGVRDGRR